MKTIEATVTIKLNIKGAEIELSPKEANELRLALGKIVNGANDEDKLEELRKAIERVEHKPTPIIERPWIQPVPQWPTPHPWYKHDIIYCGTKTISLEARLT